MTVYNGALDAVRALAARTGLAIFNDAILRAAIDFGIDALELRSVCTDPADYANAIEPSSAGGLKIANAIVEDGRGRRCAGEAGAHLEQSLDRSRCVPTGFRPLPAGLKAGRYIHPGCVHRGSAGLKAGQYDVKFVVPGSDEVFSSRLWEALCVASENDRSCRQARWRFRSARAADRNQSAVR